MCYSNTQHTEQILDLSADAQIMHKDVEFKMVLVAAWLVVFSEWMYSKIGDNLTSREMYLDNLATIDSSYLIMCLQEPDNMWSSSNIF